MTSINGLTKIIPSSINSVGGAATLSTNGLITFSSCTSIAIDGIFVNGTSNYMIVFYGQSSLSAGAVAFRMRYGGVDDNGSRYSQCRFDASGTSASTGTATSQTFGRLMVLHNFQPNGGVAYLMGTDDSVHNGPKYFFSLSSSGFGDAYIRDWATALNRQSEFVFYDGIKLYEDGGGTLTGHLSLYSFVR